MKSTPCIRHTKISFHKKNKTSLEYRFPSDYKTTNYRITWPKDSKFMKKKDPKDKASRQQPKYNLKSRIHYLEKAKKFPSMQIKFRFINQQHKHIIMHATCSGKLFFPNHKISTHASSSESSWIV